jgi:hypothetical protein
MIHLWALAAYVGVQKFAHADVRKSWLSHAESAYHGRFWAVFARLQEYFWLSL